MAESKDQAQQLNEYVKNMDSFQEGQLVKGTILEIDERNGNVFVDVGYKSEGILSLSEFTQSPKKGDELEVLLIRREGSNGLVQLSKAKADEIRFKRNLRESMEVGQIIEGVIKSQIKGGFTVTLSHGVEAFLPASKVDLTLNSDLGSYIGLKSPFVVSQFKVEKGNYNIVLDRKAYLRSQAESKKVDFFKAHSEGDIVEGTVKEFVSFGAFIDLGGFDGLLHLNDISWGHINKAKDVLEKGEKLSFKIIHLDPEKGRINLSLKEMTENPWLSVREYFREGDVLKGKVTKLATFGAFVEIKEGLEGLVHLSEFSWLKKIGHPKDVVQVGQEIQVKVLDIDSDKNRIALGVKQLDSNPWESLVEDFPVGSISELKIIKVLPSAAILEIRDGMDAYLPISEMSWTNHYNEMKDILSEGDSLKVKVIQVSPVDKRVRVSVKQLDSNPWETLKMKEAVEAILKEKKDSVWVVELDGLEAIIPKSQIALSSYGTFEEADSSVKVGDKVKALVSKVEAKKKELVLSMKELFKQKEKGEISQYLASQKEESEGYNPFKGLKADKE